MEILNVPSGYEIALVVALGYPNESPIAEDFEETEVGGHFA
jgi:hypothetical protein